MVKVRVVLVAALALALALVSLASASLAGHRSTAAILSPQTVLDWNTHAWTDVSQAMHPREVTPPATRNLFQVEGVLYMSYTAGGRVRRGRRDRGPLRAVRVLAVRA